MKDNPYFNFPLHFLLKSNLDKGHFDNIISYSIMKFIESLPEMKSEELIKKCLYCLNLNSDVLTKETIKVLEDIEDEDIEISCVLEDMFLFDNDGKYQHLYEKEVIDYIKMRPHILEILRTSEQGINYTFAQHALTFKGGTLKNTIEQYERLKNDNHQFEKKYGIDAHVSIKSNLLFAVRDGKFPVDEFRFLSAIKTIIGKRKYNHSTIKGVVLRACGAKNKNVYNRLATSQIHKLFNQYSKRYPFNKMMDSLIRKKLITKLSDTRGFFVSTGLNANDLKDRIIKNRAKYNAPLDEIKDAKIALENALK
ncbi:hypothetical protein [Maribellus mangrovi]|uniref:hypothetical protein n=1 Tax=Maribellus mangrovi TaxID=3133146 RepID=UPI0030EDEEF3